MKKPGFAYEQVIKDHGGPISVSMLFSLCEKSKSSLCKIILSNGVGSGFFFQQNISNMQFYKKYFLMTNNHVLDEKFFKNSFQILIEFKNEERHIRLNNRIKYTNENLDFTIVEILPTDSIFNDITFLKIDDYIMDNDAEDKYIEEDICIFQFPGGGELSFDKGKIKSIDGFQIEHMVSTEFGSSGSPILLLKNFKIIGLHNARYAQNNLGIFMKNILEDFENVDSPKNINDEDDNKNIKPQIKNKPTVLTHNNDTDYTRNNNTYSIHNNITYSIRNNDMDSTVNNKKMDSVHNNNTYSVHNNITYSLHNNDMDSTRNNNNNKNRK